MLQEFPNKINKNEANKYVSKQECWQVYPTLKPPHIYTTTQNVRSKH